MKNKSLLFASLALVLLIGGAALLYPRLAAQNEATAQLPTVEAPVEDESVAVPEGSAAPESAPSESAPSGDAQEETEEVLIAPNFTVYDAVGNEVQLESFFDKPVVLNFWASWCPPCRSEMPAFEAAYQAHGEDIHFLMINATYGRESQESAERFLTEEGYSFPVYFDHDVDAAGTYGAFSLPTTYFLGSGGKPVAYASGALSEDILAQGIGMIAP